MERLDRRDTETNSGVVGSAIGITIRRPITSNSNFAVVVGIDFTSRAWLDKDSLRYEGLAVAGAFVDTSVCELLASSAWHVLAKSVAGTIDIAGDGAVLCIVLRIAKPLIIECCCDNM